MSSDATLQFAKPEGLRLDEFVQFFEAAGSAMLPFNQVDGSVNAVGDLGERAHKFCQSALMDFLIAIAFGDAFGSESRTFQVNA
jgi:hypothetical protein